MRLFLYCITKYRIVIAIDKCHISNWYISEKIKFATSWSDRERGGRRERDRERRDEVERHGGRERERVGRISRETVRDRMRERVRGYIEKKYTIQKIKSKNDCGSTKKKTDT